MFETTRVYNFLADPNFQRMGLNGTFPKGPQSTNAYFYPNTLLEVDPLGSNTACKLQENMSLGEHGFDFRADWGEGLAPRRIFQAAIYVRRIESANRHLELSIAAYRDPPPNHSRPVSASTTYILFGTGIGTNLGTGVEGGTDAPTLHAHSIVDLPNNWWKIILHVEFKDFVYGARMSCRFTNTSFETFYDGNENSIAVWGAKLIGGSDAALLT